MQRVALITTLAFSLSSVAGCFNTYDVPREEFEKLQASEQVPLAVASLEGEQVLVDRDTNIFVRSVGGRRYPVTPFNFKMTSSQLVASDRDTLLALGEIAEYEVDHFSEVQTGLLIGAGVLAVTALIVVTALTAGEKSFAGDE
ncbi:MAG: hypothetical protein IT385_18105 [Deltaproteobacteria bacterium]|nr:hypothetical protein [Deltaproteobacteria bacterium]